MRGAVYGLAALALLDAGIARAQDFPDGTFASDSKSCVKLETKTPAELGEDLDFQVLSKKGLIALRQVCDFVSITPHDAKSWVATAFCDEDGYTYPDLFSIKQKQDGRLNVTRVTDLTQESSVQDSGATDAPESNGGGGEPHLASGEAAPNGGAEAGTDEQGDPASEEQAAESYSSFVKCQSQKP